MCSKPRIVVVNERLWVTLDSGIQVQSLFAVEQGEATPQPVGMVVYTREQDTLAILFVAIHEDYASSGVHADAMLFLRIVDEVRNIASRVKGIASIKLFLRGEVASHLSQRTRHVEAGLGNALSRKSPAP